MYYFRKFNRSILIGLVLLGLSVSSAQAATLPLGVHNDVLYTTVTNNWGWTEIYRDNYSANEFIANIFAGHGTHVMLGGIRDNSNTIDVLAAISWADFMTYTARHATHTANGAEWYNNSGSLGFAGLGDTIMQNTADVAWPAERDRLSWHTQEQGNCIMCYEALATRVYSGWRSGSNTGLFFTDWDKIVFTADISAVPVPAAVWLFGTALIGLVGFGKRKSRIAA
jgi:hypothetical protein